jgi:cytochrome c553
MISKLTSAFCILLTLLLVAVLGAASEPAPQNTPQPPAHPLVWDAMEKTLEVKPDEKEAKFQFNVTNKSAVAVEVLHIEPSCGCTIAEMPRQPWILAPGEQGSFAAVVNYQGKQGKFSKTLGIHSTAGSQVLTVVINIPDTEESRRARNQHLALFNRQAVFQGDCASCHVRPTEGKHSAELFQVACAICHEANPRASMVPDLKIAREVRDAAYWERWIGDGKERTLMPGFAKKHGGPLSPEQIASLVEYAMSRLPTEPPKN